MKCLDCKFREITEIGAKGFLGESIVSCRICNEIDGEMENCEDFEAEES